MIQRFIATDYEAPREEASKRLTAFIPSDDWLDYSRNWSSIRVEGAVTGLYRLLLFGLVPVRWCACPGLAVGSLAWPWPAASFRGASAGAPPRSVAPPVPNRTASIDPLS